MIFYLGSHHATQRWFDLGVPLFVSRRVLADRGKLPQAKTAWALDSGGFTELDTYGEWRTTPERYCADVARFAVEMPRLAWVAPQDWMCEPHILEKTGLRVFDHQVNTVENFLMLREALGYTVIPVLQGWEQDDYHRCWDMYEAAGVDLEREMLVGLGSVCRRQNTAEAERIVRSLAPLKLHYFGAKTTGLELFGDALVSADSMAWSLQARKEAKAADKQPALFLWPRRMLCGRVHPLSHRAKSCSNCPEWALKWRNEIMEEAA